MQRKKYVQHGLKDPVSTNSPLVLNAPGSAATDKTKWNGSCKHRLNGGYTLYRGLSA